MINKQFGTVEIRKMTREGVYRAVNALSFADFQELVALGELEVYPSKAMLKELARKVMVSSPDVWGLFKVGSKSDRPYPLMFGSVSYHGKVWLLGTAKVAALTYRQLNDIMQALRECKELATKDFGVVSNIVYCKNANHMKLLEYLGVEFGARFTVGDGDEFQEFKITRK